LVYVAIFELQKTLSLEVDLVWSILMC
jgi:hypothetical protein